MRTTTFAFTTLAFASLVVSRPTSINSDQSAPFLAPSSGGEVPPQSTPSIAPSSGGVVPPNPMALQNSPSIQPVSGGVAASNSTAAQSAPSLSLPSGGVVPTAVQNSPPIQPSSGGVASSMPILAQSTPSAQPSSGVVLAPSAMGPESTPSIQPFSEGTGLSNSTASQPTPSTQLSSANQNTNYQGQNAQSSGAISNGYGTQIDGNPVGDLIISIELSSHEGKKYSKVYNGKWSSDDELAGNKWSSITIPRGRSCSFSYKGRSYTYGSGPHQLPKAQRFDMARCT